MKLVFSILISLTIAFSIEGYKTIYLMEFENTDGDFTINHLSTSFPDLIRENYSFRKDIKIKYAGTIEPYIKGQIKNYKKGLLINGKYFVKDFNLYVEFEVFDVNNWISLTKRKIFCKHNDMLCMHDAFILALEESLSPFLVDELNSDIIPHIKELEKADSIAMYHDEEFDFYMSDDIFDDTKKNIMDQIDQFSSQADFNFNLNQNRTDAGQYGNRYFREFSFGTNDPNNFSNKGKNTALLMNLLDQFIINPYDVQIGDLKMEKKNNQKNSKDKNIHLKLPIEFSVKSGLVEDLLTNVPHQKLTNRDGIVLLQFDYDNFLFDEQFIDDVSYMRHHVFPVIFFTTRTGEMQFIVLDTWQAKYDEFYFVDFPMIRAEKFVPLFAITPGATKLQVNLDLSNMVIEYECVVPESILQNYTKVTVKFMNDENFVYYLTENFSD